MAKKPPVLRCIHRHTIQEHPACFARGDIKYDFENDLEWERLVGLPWWQYPEYRIGYLDIEVDNLNADFGTMLSWAIKPRGEEPVYSVITKKELFDEKFDKRIVRELAEEIQKYKIIVTFYGTDFDIPYVRAKAVRYGIPFPGYSHFQKRTGKWFTVPDIFHFDLYKYIRGRRLFKLSRYSLANITDYFGIKGKTMIDKESWRKAKYGNKEALEEVIDHNLHDVIITEQLHDLIPSFTRWSRRGL